MAGNEKVPAGPHDEFAPLNGRRKGISAAWWNAKILRAAKGWDLGWLLYNAHEGS